MHIMNTYSLANEVHLKYFCRNTIKLSCTDQKSDTSVVHHQLPSLPIPAILYIPSLMSSIDLRYSWTEEQNTLDRALSLK